MVPALIVMTILGCDDSVSQCHYVSTVNGTWPTVAMCDAESQKQLPKFSNSNYPVIVAVCETSDKQMAKAQDPAPMPQSALDQAHPVTTDPVPMPPVTVEQPSLPRRTLAMVTGALPDTSKIRQVVTKPVHYIEDGYSWVARKFTK
ncbi:hypothetical protein OIU34_26260 [Pararhizobium sp. BT-229]|uniref:hypothetical protein n=1 Tax=Pararhizobium sp. BT-229 TaxID=2986923 RepID=UPI0021F78F51|nr:hypothetical protein [Pararhizobium sp. BT-229]MCV9965385.1 hypothetical protein [Pararhizobium sp. BT-229]